MYLYIIVALVIVVAVAALVLSVPKASGTKLTSYDGQLVPSSLLSMLSIPNNVSSTVGIGVASKEIMPLSGPVLRINGKPEILYIGADYCPFCAAERWPMVIALMRFGTFTDLKYMTSDPNDYAPSSPTFTFYNSTYMSQYISFVSVEETTNNRSVLQQPNASELYLFSKYNPSGEIPFILFANRTFWNSASYDPESVLDGKNWTQIATLLKNTSSVQSQAIVGAANLMTAQICAIDNNTPSSVCSQQYVKKLENSIGQA